MTAESGFETFCPDTFERCAGKCGVLVGKGARVCGRCKRDGAAAVNHGTNGIAPMNADDDMNLNAMRRDARYTALSLILDEAFAQAAHGKGADRHGTGDRYEDQPAYWIGKTVGRGFQLGQAMKKVIEAERLEERGDKEAANRERLGAIVYVAFGIIESRRER